MDWKARRPLGTSAARSVVAFAVSVLASCADPALNREPGDAALDTTLPDDLSAAMDASAVGMDAPHPVDAALEVATPRDDGRHDAGIARDAGLRDAPVDVPEYTGPLLEVPLDPMGVPAPGSECAGDAGVRIGDPSIAPPRPILPHSVSRVTSQRPSFHWALPDGTTGARVEVCADRCCTRVIQTLEAEGTTVRPTATLPPGVVYWRMFGRRAGVTGSRASYTWEFGVRRRDTPVDSSWGTIRDFTGDGYDDLLMRADDYNDDGTRSLYVVEGSPGGPRTPRLIAQLSVVAYLQRANVGDFNGDGRADIAYLADVGGRKVLGVVQSDVGGTHRALQIGFPMSDMIGMGDAAVVDWNGDGYSDLVTTSYVRYGRESYSSALLIHLGSSGGLTSRPQFAIRTEPRPLGPRTDVEGFPGDLDLDGYGDIMVAYRAIDGRDIGYSFVYGSAGEPARSDALWSTSVPGGLSEGRARLQCSADVDGDGRVDIAVSRLGSAGFYIFRNVSGFDVPSLLVTEPPAAGGSDFGFTVESADLNGDGFADMLVRSANSATEEWGMTGFRFNAGRMYVYFGATEGVRADPVWFDRSRPTDPADNPSAFAGTIASPGDLNGDGFDDAAIGDFSRSTCCYVMGNANPTTAHLGGCLETPGRGVDLY